MLIVEDVLIWEHLILLKKNIQVFQKSAINLLQKCIFKDPQLQSIHYCPLLHHFQLRLLIRCLSRYFTILLINNFCFLSKKNIGPFICIVYNNMYRNKTQTYIFSARSNASHLQSYSSTFIILFILRHGNHDPSPEDETIITKKY